VEVAPVDSANLPHPGALATGSASGNTGTTDAGITPDPVSEATAWDMFRMIFTSVARKVAETRIPSTEDAVGTGALSERQPDARHRVQPAQPRSARCSPPQWGKAGRKSP
jgi:hypothetical protein